MDTPAKRSLLLTGATGQLGGYLQREIAQEGWNAVGWARSQVPARSGLAIRRVDLGSKAEVASACRSFQPTLIIHAGAISTVNGCAREPERAFQVNSQGTRVLAGLAAELHARLLLISTDLVFDGTQGNYRETDLPAPLSIYGRTKVEAEEAVLTATRAVVVRFSLLFGPSLVGRPFFFDEQARSFLDRKPVVLFQDEWRTPLHLRLAARGILRVLTSSYQGILHFGGPERMTRVEMGLRLAKHLGVADPLVDRRSRDSMPGEPRPRDTSLDSSLWARLFPEEPWPLFEEALTST